MAILHCWQAISTESAHEQARQERHLAGRSVQHGAMMPLGLPGEDWGIDPTPQPGIREKTRLK